MKEMALIPDKRYSFSVNKSLINDTLSDRTVLESTRATVQKGNSMVIQSNVYNQPVATFGQIISEIKVTLHQNIDSVIPIDLCVLDSILNKELASRGIHSRVYYSEQVAFKEGRIIQTSNLNPKVKYTNEEVFQYVYDKERQYAIRVHMPSLTGIILKQIAGVLISTLFIIILLGAAFLYLFRVIRHQKSLEEMKDDFTHNMTHELKTPIAVTYSAIDTLLNFHQGDDEKKRKKYLQICLDQLGRLGGLVEQILSISMEKRKSLALHKEKLPLQDVIDQQVALHRLKSEKPVIFSISINPPGMKVYADHVHLNNVISNLIENGIKYSGKTAHIEINCTQDETYSYLSVKDHGIGIEAHHLERIFDKFYRVPNGNIHNVKGYGLGLFYAKQIVEKHGGEISVSSILGEGSVFTIKIPRK